MFPSSQPRMTEMEQFHLLVRGFLFGWASSYSSISVYIPFINLRSFKMLNAFIRRCDSEASGRRAFLLRRVHKLKFHLILLAEKCLKSYAEHEQDNWMIHPNAFAKSLRRDLPASDASRCKKIFFHRNRNKFLEITEMLLSRSSLTRDSHDDFGGADFS